MKKILLIIIILILLIMSIYVCKTSENRTIKNYWGINILNPINKKTIIYKDGRDPIYLKVFYYKDDEMIQNVLNSNTGFKKIDSNFYEEYQNYAVNIFLKCLSEEELIKYNNSFNLDKIFENKNNYYQIIKKDSYNVNEKLDATLFDEKKIEKSVQIRYRDFALIVIDIKELRMYFIGYHS